jgi:hypothetical protein
MDEAEEKEDDLWTDKEIHRTVDLIGFGLPIT